MPETVTYRGPEDEADGSTAFRLGGYLFPRDVPVEDVPDDVVEQLMQSEPKGHTFDLGEVTPALTPPWAGYDEQTAAEIAEELLAAGDPDLADRASAYEAEHKDRKTVLDAAAEVEAPEVEQGP